MKIEEFPALGQKDEEIENYVFSFIEDEEDLSSEISEKEELISVLEKRKIEYGIDKLEEDVLKLRKFNAEVKEKCVIDVVEDTKKLEKDFIPWSKDVQGINITAKKSGCKFYGIGENQFIEYLRDMQQQRFYAWKLGQKI